MSPLYSSPPSSLSPPLLALSLHPRAHLRTPPSRSPPHPSSSPSGRSRAVAEGGDVTAEPAVALRGAGGAHREDAPPHAAATDRKARPAEERRRRSARRAGGGAGRSRTPCDGAPQPRGGVRAAGGEGAAADGAARRLPLQAGAGHALTPPLTSHFSSVPHTHTPYPISHFSPHPHTTSLTSHPILMSSRHWPRQPLSRRGARRASRSSRSGCSRGSARPRCGARR